MLKTKCFEHLTASARLTGFYAFSRVFSLSLSFCESPSLIRISSSFYERIRSAMSLHWRLRSLKAAESATSTIFPSLAVSSIGSNYSLFFSMALKALTSPLLVLFSLRYLNASSYSCFSLSILTRVFLASTLCFRDSSFCFLA